MNVSTLNAQGMFCRPHHGVFLWDAIAADFKKGFSLLMGQLLLKEMHGE